MRNLLLSLDHLEPSAQQLCSNLVLFWVKWLDVLWYLNYLGLFIQLMNCCFPPAVNERVLRTSEDFVWAVDSTFHGRFIVDVEFLDLKICPVNVSSKLPILSCV